MATKQTHNFDPRPLMEQAIEVMRKSRHEQRSDGKASPRVGALLWHPDGVVQTACRGDLRDGDHAEYTILERMNRDKRLEGCKLFATLEPCAPGARSNTKLSCAERIVLARIQEVWVGIEDPDPKVDRKGIKFLQDSGVTVHMFDRDLQEQIQSENKEFLSQAEERARAAEDEPAKPVVLSSLENPLSQVSLSVLSPPALERLRSASHVQAKVGSDEFNQRLIQQGLAARHGEQIVPTGFGLLLLGKEPRATMPQAGLLATIEYPDGKQEVKDFDGPLVSIPEDAEKWLGDKLPNVVDRGSMQRKSIPPLPFEMIREALVNALIHRDYDIRQAKCQLIVTADTVTIRSPGRPVPPITLEQLQAFNAPMLSRNPELHYVFSRLDLAEERGLGLRSLKEQATTHALPLPAFRFNDPYLDLVIYRSPAAAVHALSEDIAAKLNSDERAAWTYLSTREVVSARDLIGHLAIDERKAQRILKNLTDLRLVRRTGKGPATRYEVVRP